MPRIERYITKSLNFPNKQDPSHYCWAGDTLQVLHDIAAHRNVGTRDHARAAAVTVDAATRRAMKQEPSVEKAVPVKKEKSSKGTVKAPHRL